MSAGPPSGAHRHDEAGTGRRPDRDRDRDRDNAGRPRNARPRDAAGRPLPRGATGISPVPDDPVLPPGQAVVYAQELLEADRPFAAHEVLEAAWKAAPAEERDLWQGLAQVAVGLTHRQRGNARGAVSLLRRGADRISGYPGCSYGIDVAGVAARARALADGVAAGGADESAAGAGSLRLTDRSDGDDARGL